MSQEDAEQERAAAGGVEEEIVRRSARDRREILRPALPDCWKCGVKHFHDEPCDHGGWGPAKAIDKRMA